jgi:transposase-like protein
MNCPKCGSEMWDNRPKKESGAYSSKAPDYKCKECQHPVWINDEKGFKSSKDELKDIVAIKLNGIKAIVEELLEKVKWL